MNVNATLFVQVFNFFIVYGMLRFFLFKPIVAIIEHENSQKEALCTIIDEQKKSLEIQEREHRHNWYTCQEYFINNQPHYSYQKVSVSDASDEGSKIASAVSADIIASTAHTISNTLEEKVKHVH